MTDEKNEKFDIERNPISIGMRLYSLNSWQFMTAKRACPGKHVKDADDVDGGKMVMDDLQRKVELRLKDQKSFLKEILRNNSCKENERSSLGFAITSVSDTSKVIKNGDSQHRYQKCVFTAHALYVLYNYLLPGEKCAYDERMKDIEEMLKNFLPSDNPLDDSFEPVYTDNSINEVAAKIAKAVLEKNAIVFHKYIKKEDESKYVLPITKAGDIQYKSSDPKSDIAALFLNTFRGTVSDIAERICRVLKRKHLFSEEVISLSASEKKKVEKVIGEYINGMLNTSIIELHFCGLDADRSCKPSLEAMRRFCFTEDGTKKIQTDYYNQIQNVFCGNGMKYDEFTNKFVKPIEDLVGTSRSYKTRMFIDILTAYRWQDRTSNGKSRTSIGEKNIVAELSIQLEKNDDFEKYAKKCISVLGKLKKMNEDANEGSNNCGSSKKLYSLPLALSKFSFGYKKLDVLPELFTYISEYDKGGKRVIKPIEDIMSEDFLKELDEFLFTLLFERAKGSMMKMKKSVDHQLVLGAMKEAYNANASIKDGDFNKTVFDKIKQTKDEDRQSVPTTEFLKKFSDLSTYALTQDVSVNRSKWDVFTVSKAEYTIIQLLLKQFNVKCENLTKLGIENIFSSTNDFAFKMKVMGVSGKTFDAKKINDLEMDHSFAQAKINETVESPEGIVTPKYKINSVHLRSAFNGVVIPKANNTKAQDKFLKIKADVYEEDTECYNGEYCCCTQFFTHLAEVYHSEKGVPEDYFEYNSEKILEYQRDYLKASIQELSKHLELANTSKSVEENSGENS